MAIWIAFILLLFSCYFSSLVLATMSVSRSALEHRLVARNRVAWGNWFFDHLAETQLAMSLIRTITRLAFFAFVLVEVAGVGANSELTVTELFIAGGIAVTLLWLFSTVLASAIARYAAVGVVASGLPLLRACAFVLLPLTRALGFVDEAVRRLTGANLQESEQAEAELLRRIEDTHREGGLDERAAEMLENVVEFSSKDVGEIMTPRTEIDGIELTDDLGVIRAFIANVGHSRIPVYRENLDNVAGILYVKDLVRYLGEDATDFRLEPILRQPIVIPETKSVRELLADFQRSEVHLAIVIDEYGGTAGLVTIEDVLEEIVGEIHDEHDQEDDLEPALQKVDDHRVEVDGRYSIDDLNEDVGLDLPEDAEFDTIAGFVLSSLGRVPTTGESFESHGARFTVLDASPTQLLRVGVEVLATAE